MNTLKYLYKRTFFRKIRLLTALLIFSTMYVILKYYGAEKSRKPLIYLYKNRKWRENNSKNLNQTKHKNLIILTEPEYNDSKFLNETKLKKLVVPNKTIYNTSELKNNKNDNNSRIINKTVTKNPAKNKPFESSKMDKEFSIDIQKIKELIEKTKEIYQQSCKPNTKLLLIMISNPTNHLIRKQIRSTFAKNLKKFKYEKIGNKTKDYSHCFLFSIGYKNFEDIDRKVDEEYSIYKDIIRIPLHDVYSKLVYKVIATLHALDQTGANFEMVLKIDDDIY